MKKNRGIIKLIILIIIGLALLKVVWDIDIKDIIEFLKKPFVKEIWDALINFLKIVWNFIKNLFTK